MNAQARPTEPVSAVTRRSDLSIGLMQICLGISAENYMVLDTGCGPDGSGVRLVASNWIYDAIDMVGLDHLAGMARKATPLGAAPQPLFLDENPSRNSRICGDPESELARFGHNEVYALWLGTGARRACAFFSASSTGRIRGNLVPAAQFRSAYLLSEMTDSATCAEPADPLSERERECLFWVAEGKTTDDVALIVGVSANTANRYIAQAIRKLAAPNRAKAVAIAIRRGIL
ncbi:MAG: helix-turn-helix transcriptional regulator [Rhizobiaceae bacterium]